MVTKQIFADLMEYLRSRWTSGQYNILDSLEITVIEEIGTTE
jgi:hypothetical protein